MTDFRSELRQCRSRASRLLDFHRNFSYTFFSSLLFGNLPNFPSLAPYHPAHIHFTSHVEVDHRNIPSGRWGFVSVNDSIPKVTISNDYGQFSAVMGSGGRRLVFSANSPLDESVRVPFSLLFSPKPPLKFIGSDGRQEVEIAVQYLLIY